ncbi:Microsomal dipeptidase [hydrothermal vent metagenome]|uniref:Microsomal dipeptidase n=1 Tax=hydrothermal vent metagenome TaxID=652676 RepID=A0A3B0U0S7_9ZZZZ
MTKAPYPLIFDGHNDVLLKQFLLGAQAQTGFINGYDAHIDLPKAKAGGFGGGFFAIFVPSEIKDDDKFAEMSQPTYDIELPPAIEQTKALKVALSQAAILSRLQRDGALKICTRARDIRQCLETGTMAAVLHMEGAEAIDANLDALEVFYNAGLRSLGPVWSRPTIFGHGVPFRFPSNADTGPGLTEAGKNLVRQCNNLHIMLDMSHLNEAGFWDVAKSSDAPLVATHSNAQAICPHARNLSDKQLAAIRDSDGMVGLNFAVAFLRPDGQMNKDTGLDIMMRHLDHLLEHLGEDRVGLGSDFDGANIPSKIGDASGLVNLGEAMKKHGINDDLQVKICNANWLRVLEKTWGE